MFSLHVDTAQSWRGGQNQTLLTVLGMKAIGHRVALVAHPNSELRKRADDKVDLIPLAASTEMNLLASWRLSRIISKLKPDVIHAHDPHAVAVAALALSVYSPSPRPLLFASRRVDFHLKRNMFSLWKYRQVDFFICVSDAIRTMLQMDGIDGERIKTIAEGIDVDHVTKSPPLSIHNELGLPEHTPVVGNIAALVPHKGQNYLIEAAKLVREEKLDVKFVIAGEGELRSELETKIRKYQLEEHVFLIGFRPNVLSLLKSFDIFVMSSVTEGLGTSLLDAMACNVAIVATRVGGIPEVIEDGRNGRLVPPCDPRALSETIIDLLQDEPQRRRLAREGTVLVRERFTAKRMVEQTLKTYERLADKFHEADTAHRVDRD